uniref:Uncharacterized protein n=1 Tax=Echinococcus granulosus TaxID=6210 RepID=A0A068W9H5_ECHGR|nr:hypothetical protein EgrG_000910900 [Echinococcus granulosus]
MVSALSISASANQLADHKDLKSPPPLILMGNHHQIKIKRQIETRPEYHEIRTDAISHGLDQQTQRGGICIGLKFVSADMILQRENFVHLQRGRNDMAAAAAAATAGCRRDRRVKGRASTDVVK